jgi:hypothetical protein
MELTQEQLDRLNAFKEQHGRNWKDKLRTLWMQGKDANEPQGHLLRQIRNRIGPSGLDKLKG